MKVLYVITGLHKGGAEGQLLELVRRMLRRGHRVEVVSALPASGYADDLRALGVVVHSLEIQLGRLDPRALPRLARIIWRFRPDVVHSFMVHANLLTRLIRLVAPAKVVVNTALGISESRTPEHSSRPRELAYTVTDFLSDTTTQVSQLCADHYVALRAVPRRKMRVVPVGIDSSKFRRFSDEERERCRAEFELPADGSFWWICVARLTPDKDHQTLLAAFKQLRDRQPSAKLVLKGIGALEAELRATVKTLGLDGSVRFVTARVEIERLLNAGDAFVLSSVREGMPTVLLEAAGCELPIVATDVGGNREVALDGQSGFIAPPSNSAQLAEAMERLMQLSPLARLEFGRVGRDLVERNFELERVTTQYEELYSRLAKET